jgi:hypothetical protein
MADVDEREARDPFSGPRADLGKRAETTDTIIIGVAVIAGLYFGREVLVPMSIAVLLSFVLALDLPRICGERFQVYAACLSN